MDDSSHEDRVNSALELLLGLSSGGKLLCKVLYGSERPKTTPNLVSGIISEIVSGIEQSKDFSHVYPTISRLIDHQEDRANLVSNLLVFDDFRRAAVMVEVRNQLESDLILAAKEGKLRPAERIILLQLVDKRMDSIERRIAGKGSNIEDITSVLEKANYAVEMRGDALRKKFGESSPQGREIIRKLITRIGRELKAAEG